MKGGYRQNLALTGPMLSGKSSILRHFLMNLKDPDVIPLYIEMVEEGYEDFCMRFMATLLYRYLRSIGGKNDGDFADLKKACSGLIPKTASEIEEICQFLKKKKNDEAYQKLLNLPAVFKDETGKNCIVILDEFHNLSNFRLKKPFQAFGKHIMVQKNTMYVVSSSQKTLLKEILARKLSLLFGNFEVIEVGGFDNQTAHSFVSDKSRDLSFNDNIKDFLIQLCQGNPLYLEVLIKRFTDLLGDKGKPRDEKECLVDAFADTVYDSNGILNQYFTNSMNFFLEKKSRKKFLPVLIALAKGANTIKTVKEFLGRHDKELSSKLERLQHMDLIFKSGVFYKISDKLFEYWVRNVYCIKTKSMIDDMDIKYLEFKGVVEKDYLKFCDHEAKDVIDIITGLFRSFRNEKVNIGMHEKKMPKFDSVASRRINENASEITGKIGKNQWVCRVKRNDMVDENDLYDLVEMKPKTKEAKISRKIIIPLKGIEHHAFLLAKEKNIWVWKTSRLNRILRLYDNSELVI